MNLDRTTVSAVTYSRQIAAVIVASLLVMAGMTGAGTVLAQKDSPAEPQVLRGAEVGEIVTPFVFTTIG